MKKLVTVAAITMGIAVLAYTQINQQPPTESHTAQTADSRASTVSADIKLAHADQNDVADNTQSEQNQSDNNAADNAQAPQSDDNSNQGDAQPMEEDTESSASGLDDYGSGDEAGSLDTSNDGDDEDEDGEDTSTTVQPS